MHYMFLMHFFAPFLRLRRAPPSHPPQLVFLIYPQVIDFIFVPLALLNMVKKNRVEE